MQALASLGEEFRQQMEEKKRLEKVWREKFRSCKELEEQLKKAEAVYAGIRIKRGEQVQKLTQERTKTGAVKMELEQLKDKRAQDRDGIRQQVEMRVQLWDQLPQPTPF